MSSTPTDVEAPLRNTQVLDAPERTMMYGGALIEDIQPLVQQGRFNVRFNNSEYRPPYIDITERTARQRIEIADDLIAEQPDLEEDDVILREQSVGFEIKLRFQRMLSPDEMGSSFRGPQCFGLHFMGVHERWMSHNCSITDYGVGTNSDGQYELSFQVDRFKRKEHSST